MNSAELGLVILAAAEVPNFLAGMMPSLFTIRTFAGDPEKVEALRRGEVVGSLLSLAVGVGASLVAKRPEPFLACAAVLGVLLYEYEKAIRDPIGAPLDMAAAGSPQSSSTRLRRVR